MYFKTGKKTKEWNSARRVLIPAYEMAGITGCEMCHGAVCHNFALGFAHGKKRGSLVGRELYTLVVLLGQICHDSIEYIPKAEGGHARMQEIVEEIIAARPVQPHIVVKGEVLWG